MAFIIEDYSFGKITISGRLYTSDLLICPDRVIPDWWRKEGHSLVPEDLNQVMGLSPRKLIIGSGSPGMLEVPDPTKKWLEQKGIEFLILPTSQACEQYNKSPDKVGLVVGLHLTC